MDSNRIRELREKAGMTQEGLAIALDMSKRSVSSLEQGTMAGSIDTLIKLADLFKVSTDYLLGREPAAVEAAIKNSPPPLGEGQKRMEITIPADSIPASRQELEQLVREMIRQEVERPDNR